MAFADLPFVRQNVVFSETQELINARGELGHRESVFPLYQVFDVVKIARNQPLQTTDVLLREIVFRDYDVGLQDSPVRRVLPCGKPHVFLLMVGSGVDNFGGGLPSNRVMEFILDCGIKLPRHVRVFIVIHAAFGENVRDLLPNTSFTGTNGTYALQQFAEVVFAENGSAPLQPFVIEGKAFDHIFAKDPRRPYSEMRRPLGVNAVADGDDGVEIVEICILVLCFPLNRAVLRGCCKFCNNHFFVEFAFVEDVFQMTTDS